MSALTDYFLGLGMSPVQVALLGNLSTEIPTRQTTETLKMEEVVMAMLIEFYFTSVVGTSHMVGFTQKILKTNIDEARSQIDKFYEAISDPAAMSQILLPDWDGISELIRQTYREKFSEKASSFVKFCDQVCHCIKSKDTSKMEEILNAYPDIAAKIGCIKEILLIMTRS